MADRTKEAFERRSTYPYDSNQQAYGYNGRQGVHLLEPRPTVGPILQTPWQHRGPNIRAGTNPLQQIPRSSDGQQRNRSRSPRRHRTYGPQSSETGANLAQGALGALAVTAVEYQLRNYSIGTTTPTVSPTSVPHSQFTESPVTSPVEGPHDLKKTFSNPVEPVTPRFLSVDTSTALLWKPQRLTAIDIWLDAVEPAQCKALLDTGSEYNIVSQGLLERLKLYRSRYLRELRKPEELCAGKVQAGAYIEINLISRYLIKLNWRMSNPSPRYTTLFWVVEGLPLDVIINRATIEEYNLKDLTSGLEHCPDSNAVGIIFTVVSKLSKKIRELQQQLNRIKGEMDAAKAVAMQWSQASKTYGDQGKQAEQANATRCATAWNQKATQLRHQCDAKQQEIDRAELDLRRAR